MFGADEMIFTMVLIGITSIGTYSIAKEKYLKAGIEIGSELTIDALIADGYLEIKIDSNGEESLLSVKEIRDSVIR
jgi:hypothetical protein